MTAAPPLRWHLTDHYAAAFPSLSVFSPKSTVFRQVRQTPPPAQSCDYSTHLKSGPTPPYLTMETGQDGDNSLPPAQVYNPSPPPPPSLSITSYCDAPFCPQYKIILTLFSYTVCIISSFLLIPSPNQERAALPGTARVKRIPSTIKFNFFLLSINLFSRFLFKWFYWGKLCFFFCLGICPPSSVAFYLCVQKKGTLTVPWRYGSHGMW